jgi:hypothetical protein
MKALLVDIEPESWKRLLSSGRTTKHISEKMTHMGGIGGMFSSRLTSVVSTQLGVEA